MQTSVLQQRLLDQLCDRAVERAVPKSQRKGKKWESFLRRFNQESQDLYINLQTLYGQRPDLLYFFEDLIATMWGYYAQRRDSLLERDAQQEHEPDWFRSEKHLGGVLYIDLFSDTIQGLIQHLDYLEELGIDYLHLMPLYATPEGESDGGYAVASYRKPAKGLGELADFEELAKLLEKKGITLVLDFILNHTSDEHEWALKAMQGDPYYRDFYFIFPDRSIPDAYGAHLRDIFPEVRKGSFTYREEVQGWVWTTFNSFQWDLNYRNPEVFKAMSEEMLFLANLGTGVLRFDAIAFVWKELGTRCESLPNAHTLIRCFRAVAKIAAPSLLFKSEAIVHPDEVMTYIDTKECELSYNPLLMATLWEALATRNPRLLRTTISRRFQVPEGCAWVNYTRCHDDIGWTFDDHDAALLGIDGFGHRQFLNAFYTGRHPGSFAKGLPFQENPITKDCRVCGTGASLAGLEKGIALNDKQEQQFAVRKILLLYGLISSLGGIPLIYLGDELGVCNDYSYREDPLKAADSRWVHRKKFDWDQAALRNNPGTLESIIYTKCKTLFSLRKKIPAFSVGSSYVLSEQHPHILVVMRQKGDQKIYILANFSDYLETVTRFEMRVSSGSGVFEDLLTEKIYSSDIVMQPWELLWLQLKES